MALLAGGLSAIVLFTSLGGTTYPWGSPTIIGLMIAGVVLLVAFVVTESRAAEPVLPLSLFRNSVFSLTSVIGFIIGLALFGSITYLPLFLQIVKGSSATASGLQLLPLMAGVLVASIGSGLLITKLGRYKMFPIIGTALMAVGLFLLSGLEVDTSIAAADVYMVVLGLGLGFVMQVLVLAVQNAVEYRELGVATSGATLFRSMGGAIGVPIFGAIFANQLDVNLAEAFPLGVGGGDSSFQGSPAEIAKLPPEIHQPFITAYADSLSVVFGIAAIVALLAFALTWFLREVPLRQTISDVHIDEAFLANLFAAPRDSNSLSELEQKLGLLTGRENRHWVYEALTERAQADLTAQQLWLLFRLRDEGPDAAVPVLAERVGDDRERLRPEMRDLVERGLVHVGGVELGEAGMTLTTTEAGNEILHAVDEARREHLEAVLADWQPETHPELLQLLERFQAELAKQAPV